MMNTIELKRDGKRISIILQDAPAELGICGSIVSSLFPYEISIVATDSANKLNFNYACIGKTPTYEMVFMILETEIYEKLKIHNAMALFVVLHEIGHLVNGDLNKVQEEKTQCYNARISILESGMVGQCEIEADAFAAYFMGKESVANGLCKLREVIAQQYRDSKMAITELDRRIEILTETL